MSRDTEPKPVVVIVNDDPTQLTVLCGLARKAGLAPRPFDGAEAALAAMRPSAPPALIVADLYMPGLDGWRFCRLLRAPEYAAYNAVPILVVSATFSGDHPERIAADIGADAFLPVPVDGAAFAATARSLLEGAPTRRRPRVLIVEDGAPLAAQLQRLFTEHGYQADTAASRQAAAAAFAAHDCDVAILDFHLPDGTGDSLLDDFHARRPACVCLMMTTDPTPALALDWMKRGAAAYLHKPFDPAYLIELCARARRERASLHAEDLLDARTRELRDEHRRMEAILEGTHAGTWEWNVQTGATVFNARWAAIVGYTLDELAPVSINTWLALLHPDDRERANTLLTRHLTGERPYYDCDCRLRHKEGHWVWVRDHGKVTAWTTDGRPLWMSGTHIDITDRKQAEEALRDSEETYRALVNGLPDVIMRFDRAGRHLFVSDNVSKVIDMEAAQFIGKTHAELGLPAESCRAWERAIRQVFETGRPYETEFMFAGKAGDVIFNWRLAPQRDAHGAVTTVLSISRDITAHRQAERDYRTLFREMLDGFALHEIVCDAAGAPVDYRFLAVNPAFERITGLRSEAIIGRTVLECLPNTEQYWIETYGRVALTGEPAFFENYAAQFGKYFDVTAFRPAPGQFACIFQDITARKQTEAALKASEERLRLAHKATNDVIWDWDVIADAQTWSAAGEVVFGWTDIVRVPQSAQWWAERVHPDDRKRVETEFEAALNDPEATYWHDEYRFRKADGTYAQVMDRGFVMRDAEGRAIRMVGAMLDITARKQAEAERETLQTQLVQAQKMESVGRLAGGVAHDFNNMLGVILGQTELMLEEIPADSPLRADLDEIRKAAQRSADLTRQLLAFARKQTVAPRVIDLNAQVEGILKLLTRLIGESIAMEWRPGANLGPVEIDPAQLDQILTNLCLNARDAIAGVGRVTIATTNVTITEEQGFHQADALAGAYVSLAVSDTGCGMDQVTIGHLFEPFYTTKEVGKGTGLGLATVYGMVKQNHGFIDVVSAPGRGTTITIYLPRHARKAVRPAADDTAPAPTAGRETILLVEDEPAILKMTRRMLERLGYAVLAAGSPGEALRLAREHTGPLDLLMTDVVMPEMSGRELAHDLLPLYPGIKRLFMSGYTANVIAHHGVLDPGIHFIQKPFTTTELAATLRVALGNG